ncbi:MAG: 2-phosphoglycerate kinase [Cyanomargarita calcarea GSE-NOS-MK-12-04C]|jgi:2-phosphoglycerate kinase|uniref:2-phosphoglycerate kinase n=1 Tax=Cyanomargarita calcarea GSE-NOS-MK-12-04C TaxID=2839659 RepID=A0A951QLS3_9CYAN|nr:2-phosphoglycerate kinase [Cyanomargarita calcarea GSE-NOS-MK-12-04C]
MDKLINETRVILIGGSSHAGKSTLGLALAAKLGWSYRSTDKLARHPGRPWVGADRKAIPEHVAEYYRELSVEALFLDVLSHYEKNVLSIVEVIVRSHASDLSAECLVLEGSALWPEFVANLVDALGVKAIWLTASNQLFQNRIKRESNFCNVRKDEKHLIQKFLDRTLFYDKHMREEVKRLGFMCIDVESVSTADGLLKKCMELMEAS